MTLIDHLKSPVTTVCWCWRITRLDGVILGFTDHDRELNFIDTLFEPESGFTASSLQDTNDLAVDSQDIQGALSSDRITEEDIITGVWDSAGIEVYLVNWEIPEQHLLIRRGTLGEISRGKHVFTAEVRSFSAKLTDVKGRFYQYFCDARLGDARCGVDLSSPDYSSFGEVIEVLPYNRVIATGGLVSYDSDWFSHGVLTKSSGERFMVMSCKVINEQAHITFFGESSPLLSDGDTFTIEAGCDKSFRTCLDKYSNSNNFRGFPHIPGNTILQRYPKERGIYSGGPYRQ